MQEPKERPGKTTGPHLEPKKLDLATCPVEDIVKAIKAKKCTIDELPYKRRAQVKAFVKKEKPKPDLSDEKVADLETMVKERIKQVGEIPLQKRIQLERKMALENEWREYRERIDAIEDNPPEVKPKPKKEKDDAERTNTI